MERVPVNYKNQRVYVCVCVCVWGGGGGVTLNLSIITKENTGARSVYCFFFFPEAQVTQSQKATVGF